MRSNKLVITFIIASLLIVVLSSCAAPAPTEDPTVKFTQIAATVQAELTRVAALTPSATPTLEATATATMLPPTETPSGPTATPTKTPYPTALPNAVGADNASYAADVTVPDGTTFAHGEAFVKTWRLKNTGKTTWTTDYQWVYAEGNLVGANGLYKVNIPKEVKPGEYLEVSINFKTPDELGSYYSYWRMYSASGIPFGDFCSVKIISGSYAATVAPTTAPTAKP
jgi:hypothetical protein